jgi:hypothetical protein
MASISAAGGIRRREKGSAMSMATLKPVLIVVMISLPGICATSLFNHNAGPLTFSRRYVSNV